MSRTAGVFAVLRRLISLPRYKQRLIFEILITALWVEFSLRFNSLTTLLKSIHANPKNKTLDLPADAIHRLVASVQRRLPFPRTCLRQGLISLAVLQRRGCALELKIGVKKEASALDAHAWLERDGVAQFGETERCREFAAFEETVK